MKPGKSLSTKIILMVEAILLFSSAVFCLVSISRARIGIRQAIQQRMVDIANCASGSVNGDILKELKAGDEGTPGYQAVYDTMAVFRDNAELEYIYAIRDEGNGRFTFVVDTDPDAPGQFGDEVQYTEALGRATKGTTAVDEVPYSDQWGQFYSAYSPVFDSSGRVAGIVAADFPVAWFDAQLEEQTRANVRGYIIILLGMILVAAVLCMVTVRPYMKVQEQLLAEKVTAESANRAKSEFLANMSHEIRTPINAVLGMNEMILRKSRQGRNLPAGSTEETRKVFDQIGFYAGEVEGAGRGLLGIINDILDFSRIEAGRMELVKDRYQLSSVLNDVSSMILFKAREKGLEFTLDVDETIPDNLFGDEVRVREIIMNLLTNAVKYTAQGFVRLSVHAEARSGDMIHIVFIAEDSGIGIKREDMDKLFNKFERLDMQRNSTVEGSGLGLVITRSLLDMMGGTIRVESEYGKGSVFTVTIPQQIVQDDPVGDLWKRFETNTAKTTVYRETFHAPDARLLIVDDTKMNLTVTASLLKSTEMQIDTAGSGSEAVKMAAEKEYDVIFMDQRMPEMDGTETLRRIRQSANSLNRETPVICLTADAVMGARDRYLAEGFSDYLSKPVDSRKLEAMLMNYLPEEKMAIIPEPAEEEAEEQMPVRRTDEFSLLQEAGIDPNIGLHSCQGNRELYRTLLAEFLREYHERSEAMRRYYELQDWKNYGVYTHSLKSSARMLGAQALSETAARLEAAADEENGEPIRQEHEPMMLCYEAVIRSIREIVQITDEEENSDMMEFTPVENGGNGQ